jgi:Tfp pilus assembly protein PilV
LTKNPLFICRLATSVDIQEAGRLRSAEDLITRRWHGTRFSWGMRARTAGSRRAGAGARGESLIEVLVATALVLALIVGAAEMLTLALRAKRRGDVLAAFTQAVTERLEGLKARPFDDPALAAGTYAETVRVEPGACLISETWQIADEADGLKRVRLTAREAGRPGPGTAAVLYVSRDLGFRP